MNPSPQPNQGNKKIDINLNINVNNDGTVSANNVPTRPNQPPIMHFPNQVPRQQFPIVNGFQRPPHFVHAPHQSIVPPRQS